MLRPAVGIFDLVVLPFLLAACGGADGPAASVAEPAAQAPEALPATPVALVELFTSEGCSSCPPADALLGELAGREGVVALAFHVDYWNYLGWRDPYSDAAFSARQRAYARRLDGRVYTPQMVVNGEVGFVGSRRREAEQHLDEARPLPQTITLAVRPDDDALAVDYAVADAPEGAVLHLALVERSTAQDVRRGENRGRRLSHTNVVRVLETVAPGTGHARLPFADGLTADNVGVAAWVQEGEVGPVLGAAWAGG